SPVARAARHPRQLGPGRLSQGDGRRQRAGRSRESFPHEDDRALGTQALGRRPAPPPVRPSRWAPVARELSSRASPPGAVGISRPLTLVNAGDAHGPTEKPWVPNLAAALRSRSSRIGDSSSGSSPASRTVGACSTSSYV